MIERVLELIETNGITAAKLADDIGLANSAISEWKKGKSKPSVDAVIKIAQYFGVTTDYLLTGERVIKNKKGIMNMNEIKSSQINSEDARKISDAMKNSLEKFKPKEMMDAYLEVFKTLETNLKNHIIEAFNVYKNVDFEEMGRRGEKALEILELIGVDVSTDPLGLLTPGELLDLFEGFYDSLKEANIIEERYKKNKYEEVQEKLIENKKAAQNKLINELSKLSPEHFNQVSEYIEFLKTKENGTFTTQPARTIPSAAARHGNSSKLDEARAALDAAIGDDEDGI